MNAYTPLSCFLCCLFLTGVSSAQTISSIDVLPEKSFDISDSEKHVHELNWQDRSGLSHQTLPHLDAQSLLHQPKLLQQAVVSSIVLNNIAGLRQLLPIYQQLSPTQRDDDLLVLIEAKIKASDGKNADAADIYKRILERYPNLDTIRLDRALNLFYAYHDDEAKEELQKLRQLSLSKSIGQGVDSYLDQLSKRNDWQFHAGMNYLHESNINNAPKTQNIVIHGDVWTPPKPQKAKGFSYRFGAEKNSNIIKNYFWNNELNVNGRFYWNAHRYDELSMRLSSGVLRKHVKHQFLWQPFYEKTWYGGKPFLQEWGMRLEQKNKIHRSVQMVSAWEVGKEVFDNKRLKRDGMRNHFSLTWRWSLSPRQMLAVGYDASFKNANDKSDAYHRYGWRGAWVMHWQNGLEHQVNLGVARRFYQGVDLFNIQRSEREWHAQIGLSHRKIKVYGLRPKLLIQWTKRDSNHPFYSFSKANVFVQMNKSF